MRTGTSKPPLNYECQSALLNYGSMSRPRTSLFSRNTQLGAHLLSWPGTPNANRSRTQGALDTH